MAERTAFPLSWPEGWKRAKYRERARFAKTKAANYQNGQLVQNAGKSRLSVADAVRRILGELSRMGIGEDDIIISTNVKLRLDGMPRSDQEPGDPGAAVYWQKKNQAMRCMAIDQYDRVADNLAAIAATLDAMRAIERHGGAEILNRAFLGFAALPQAASQPWREVLGIAGNFSGDRNKTLEMVEDRFKSLAHVHHPDKGGDSQEFQKIVQARDAARLELAS